MDFQRGARSLFNRKLFSWDEGEINAMSFFFQLLQRILNITLQLLQSGLPNVFWPIIVHVQLQKNKTKTTHTFRNIY